MHLYLAAQPLGTVLHGATKLGSLIGKSVAIVGQGQNGLLMTQLISQLGARQVICLDLMANRLELAKTIGATHTVNVTEQQDEGTQYVKVITGGRGVDVAIEMVGHQGKTFRTCCELCKSGGTVLVFGLPPADRESELGSSTMGFTLPDMVKNLTLMGTHSPAPESFELAMEMLHQGRIDVRPVFTHEFDFARFPEAYTMQSNYRDGLIKCLVKFSGPAVAADHFIYSPPQMD
eukprot:TRINITY_DN56286_c0_g1_i1.p1 TRINITY_DN56286_c0_g1~~TRINITY_DN56286_c0_g1_i1.p1  ORF type:complete len:233 (-),score=49.91 TRINITY_DN56286_c0_g1_i1:81-779(-)